MPIVALPAIEEPEAPAEAAMIAVPELREASSKGSELWLVSTRRLPMAGDSGVSPQFSPDVYRYAGARGWIPSSLAEFVRSEPPDVVTSIFVHGNDTDAAYAAGGGGNLFSQVLAGAATEAPPMRFVIWSWPNEQTSIRVRKSARQTLLELTSRAIFWPRFSAVCRRKRRRASLATAPAKASSPAVCTC